MAGGTRAFLPLVRPEGVDDMAYDEKLAERTRRVIGSLEGVTEKKMFGGLAFLQDGKMVCGILGPDLMVRVGPDRYEAALARDHVRRMDFTGRPMTGYVFVGPEGTRTEQAVKRWVDEASSFVASLAARPKKRGKNRSVEQ